MRIKTLCLFALLLATLCQLPRLAQAQDGDWTPTYRAEWWWKYVHPSGIPQWTQAVQIDSIVIDNEQVIVGTPDTNTAVTYSFKNTSRYAFKGDGSVLILHTIRAPDGSVRSQETIARAVLPALAPGQAFRVRGTAFTSARFRGLRHYLEVQVR